MNTRCDHHSVTVNVCSQCCARSIYLLCGRCTQNVLRTTITPNYNPNQQEINMCHKCAPMYLAELPPAAQEAISRLNTLSAAIDEASSSVNKTEDIYRDSAIVYHCSQLAARQPANFPQTQLDQLKELFELSSVEEYDAHFGTLHGIVRSLAELRATHVRYSGSTEDLCKRVRELEAAFNVLSIQLRGFIVAMDIRIDIAGLFQCKSSTMVHTC